MKKKRHSPEERHRYAVRAAVTSPIAVAREAGVQSDTVVGWMNEFKIPRSGIAARIEEPVSVDMLGGATADADDASSEIAAHIDAIVGNLAKECIEIRSEYTLESEYRDSLLTTRKLWDAIKLAGDADNKQSPYHVILQSWITEWAEDVAECGLAKIYPEPPAGMDEADWKACEPDIEQALVAELSDMRWAVLLSS